MEKLLLTADWHLRSKRPKARIDNYDEAQWDSVLAVDDLRHEERAHLVLAGDLFHTAKPAHSLIERLLHLSMEFYGIAGNHDLPNHAHKNVRSSGIGIMEAADQFYGLHAKDFDMPGMDTRLHFLPFGSKLGPRKEDPDRYQCKYNVAVCHELIFPKKNPLIPGAGVAKSLLKKMKGYDLIVVGDNHETFVEEYEGRWLVNPGSLMATNADQMDHDPCVFVWEPGKDPEQIFLDVCKSKDVLSREHIEIKNEREARLNSFIENLKEGTDESEVIDFVRNMKEYLLTNEEHISEEVEDIIWSCIPDEQE